MLLIRPMIRANDDRRHKTHVFVFFIFLVSNIGGALTPLGDPPLFLGFLKGVSFFWTTEHLFREMLLCAVVLLTLFYGIDSYWYRKEGRKKPDPTPESPIRIEGGVNIILLAIVVGIVLASGTRNPGGALHGLPRPAGAPACAARPRPGRRHRPVAHADAPPSTCRQCLHLGANGRSRQAVRRHLRHHRAGPGHPARRFGRRAGARWSPW